MTSLALPVVIIGSNTRFASLPSLVIKRCHATLNAQDANEQNVISFRLKVECSRARPDTGPPICPPISARLLPLSLPYPLQPHRRIVARVCAIRCLPHTSAPVSLLHAPCFRAPRPTLSTNALISLPIFWSSTPPLTPTVSIRRFLPVFRLPWLARSCRPHGLRCGSGRLRKFARDFCRPALDPPK